MLLKFRGLLHRRYPENLNSAVSFTHLDEMTHKCLLNSHKFLATQMHPAKAPYPCQADVPPKTKGCNKRLHGLEGNQRLILDAWNQLSGSSMYLFK